MAEPPSETVIKAETVIKGGRVIDSTGDRRSPTCVIGPDGRVRRVAENIEQ